MAKKKHCGGKRVGVGPNAQVKKNRDKQEYVERKKKIMIYETPLALDGETVYGLVATVLGGLHYHVKCMGEPDIRTAHVRGSFNRKQKQQVQAGDKKKSEPNRLVVGSIVLVSLREFNLRTKGVSCDIIHAYSKKEIQHLINEKLIDESLLENEIYQGPPPSSSSSDEEEDSETSESVDIDFI